MAVKDNIKIFYSWQSDLPNSEARGFIQDCINAAVKSLRDTVAVDADRDTKGEYGSPDITETIFAKIDDCDIFIADVSIVNKYDSQNPDEEEIRYSPNPNVLIELGYAATVVGWENIICFFNTDYGSTNDLPFDIDHRRVTCYSLKGKEKSDVRKKLRGIIADTVMNLLENGKRVRSSFSNIIVGSYDFKNNEISRTLIPWEIGNSPVFLKEKEDRLDACRRLINEISEIQLDDPDVEIRQESDAPEEPKENATKDGYTRIPVKSNWISQIASVPQLVKIEGEDRERTADEIKKYLNLDLDDNFFNLGNLKRKVKFMPGEGSEEIGSEDEKGKYRKIIKLQYLLSLTHMLDTYVSTFDGLYILPLATRNVSTVTDGGIDIYIEVDSETADVVEPDENLIAEELVGIEGLMCGEDNWIKKFLMMPENTAIQYEDDISYDINDKIADARRQILASPFGQSEPKYNKDDYSRELSKYIEKRMEGSSNEYAFYLKELKPCETKWVGAAILLRPKTAEIVLNYNIRSQKSDGNLAGTLKYKIECGQ